LAEVENAVVSLLKAYKNTALLLRSPKIFEETEERTAEETRAYVDNLKLSR
jgi:hypothetical protein